MKSIFHKAFVGVLASVALACSAQSADIKERTLKFSFVQPADSHMGFGAKAFADLVAQKSGNKIKVRLFPNGTLGGDLQTVSALQGGTIELTTGGLIALGLWSHRLGLLGGMMGMGTFLVTLSFSFGA